MALVVLFFAYWSVDIVSPTLPTIRDALGLSAAGAGLIFSVFFAGRLLTNLPAAWMVERAGPKQTAMLGAAVLTAGSVLVAISPSQLLLLPARGVQGAGIALLATAGLLSVLRALPGGGAAMTAFNVSSGIGGSVGLLLGGFLTTEVGWRSVFWLCSAIGLLLLVCASLAKPQEAAPRHARPEPAEFDAHQSSRIAEVFAILANLLVFTNYAIWVVSIPLLSATRFGLEPGEVGLVLFFVNTVHLLCALPVGRLIRRAGAPRALVLGFGISGLGMLAVPLADNVTFLAIPLALYALGQVAGNSAAGDLILRLGGGGGKAVGAVRLSSDIGMVAGPAVVGLIADGFGIASPFHMLGIVSLVTMSIMILVPWRKGPRGRAPQQLPT